MGHAARSGREPVGLCGDLLIVSMPMITQRSCAFPRLDDQAMSRTGSRPRSDRGRSAAARRRGAARSAIDSYVLEDQVGHLLRRAHQRHTTIFAAGMNELRLTPMQFAALAKIGAEGELSQNRLGRVTAMDPATIQGVVRRLAQRRLIVARADPGDRRRSLWRLSAAGRRLLGRAIPKALRISAETLKPIHAGRRRDFVRLLKQLS